MHHRITAYAQPDSALTGRSTRKLHARLAITDVDTSNQIRPSIGPWHAVPTGNVGLPEIRESAAESFAHSVAESAAEIVANHSSHNQQHTNEYQPHHG